MLYNITNIHMINLVDVPNEIIQKDLYGYVKIYYWGLAHSGFIIGRVVLSPSSGIPSP